MSDETGRRAGSKTVRQTLFAVAGHLRQDMAELYEFGPFRLEPAERRLSRNNELVVLTPKAFDTLVLLVRNSGHLLEKEELSRTLWPDSFVEEAIFPITSLSCGKRWERIPNTLKQYPSEVTGSSAPFASCRSRQRNTMRNCNSNSRALARKGPHRALIHRHCRPRFLPHLQPSVSSYGGGSWSPGFLPQQFASPSAPSRI